MALFITFVLLAMLLGAGSMLAPVWSADKPPNGLTATLLLGIIIIGALLWMQFYQWDTLIIDYLVFGIVSAVVLGGTMVQIQDENNEDNQAETAQNSNSRSSYLFWGIITLCSALPIILASTQNTAADTIVADMQSALSIQALIADYPQLNQFGASGFYTIALYLAEQLRQPITLVYPAVMTATTLLITITAYDLGNLRNAKLGYILSVVSLVVISELYWLTPTAYLYVFVSLFLIALLTYIARLFIHYTHLELLGLAITIIMLVFLF